MPKAATGKSRSILDLDRGAGWFLRFSLINNQRVLIEAEVLLLQAVPTGMVRLITAK
jgi:hypothetical protein